MVLAYLPHGRAFKRFVSIGRMRDRNVTKRLVVWKDALRMIRARPIIGVGPGEFKTACHRFEDASETKKIAHAPQDRVIYRDHAHNLFLQVGAESGIAGLVALAWGMAVVFRAVCDRMRNESDPARRSMVQCIAAALLAFIIFSVTDCSWTGRFSGSSFMHINFIVMLAIAMLYAMTDVNRVGAER
ncbi:MAG: O-antigen ligase family protein [bacterium]